MCMVHYSCRNSVLGQRFKGGGGLKMKGCDTVCSL